MPRNIHTWETELEKWEQADYDGIKGHPPEWVPLPHKKEFNMARCILLLKICEKKVDYQEIKSHFDKSVESNRYRIVLALMKDQRDYDEQLFFLVDIYVATLLGPEKGLERLAGVDAVSGFRFRQGYKRRPDYEDKRDCQTIGKELWKSNPEATAASLVRSPELSSYAIKYMGRNTLLDWLREIDPRPPEKKRGARRKN